MTARRFKVGDRVRCTDGWGHLKEGEEYTVAYYEKGYNGDDFIHLKENPSAGWYERRFELASTRRSKVGDRVRFVTNGGFGDDVCKPGDFAYIESLDSDGSGDGWLRVDVSHNDQFNTDETNLYFFATEYELAPLTIEDLVVGARVRTDPNGWFGAEKGREATVTRINLDPDDGSIFGGRLVFDNGSEWAFFAREIVEVLSVPKQTPPAPKPLPVLAPQTQKVLDLLRSKGSTTGVEAASVLKVRSLPRRICDLKAAGYGIETELRKDTEGQRYARYYLVNDLAAAA